MTKRLGTGQPLLSTLISSTRYLLAELHEVLACDRAVIDQKINHDVALAARAWGKRVTAWRMETQGTYDQWNPPGL